MIVKLKPELKSYLWGGKNLKKSFNKKCEEGVISESWELSFHPDGPSLIASGRDFGKPLYKVATRRDWGKNCSRFEYFPVLNKLIDSAQPLSVQVHPSDEFALKHEGQFGKSEMWHILSAQKGAHIYLGLNQNLSKRDFYDAVTDGVICDCLNRIPVTAGQTFFIPSGTVHAIGAGITLFEVQQNSSLTYRIFDYNRRDGLGNLRPLHLNKAIRAVNLKKFTPPKALYGELLGRCKYFSAYLFSGQKTVGMDNSFVSVTVVDGDILLGELHLCKGETAFLSAGERAKILGGGSYIATCVE